MANDRMIAAPLAAGGSSFSPWWIIGPLLALIAAMALAALVYAIKKKHDLKKQAEEENDPGKRETNQNKEENSEDRDRAKKSPIENLPLTNMKPDTKTKEQKRTTSMSSTVEG
jgi:phosphate/sulfate permease